MDSTYFVEIDGLSRQDHSTPLPSMHHFPAQQGQEVRLRVVANSKICMKVCVHLPIWATQVT